MSAMPAFGKQRLGLRTNLCLMLLFGVGSVGSFAAGAVRTASGSYARSFMMNAMCWVVIVGCAVDYALVTRRLNRPCVVKDVEAP